MSEDKIWSIFDYNSDYLNDEPISIDSRMKISNFLRASKQRAKRNECFYCGKVVDSFCNSHSIPLFTLKNIAKDGKLINLNRFIKIPFFNEKIGLNKTGTFQIICRECDSKVFSDYENPDNYKIGMPTQKMLSQIAMKTYLNSISKKHIENSMLEELKKLNHVVENQLYIKKLDLEGHILNYQKAKRNLLKNWDEYYVIYYKILEYTVPIAFQDEINIVTDLNGRIINNIYNYDQNYEVKGVHLCVFPFKQKTALIMFVHKDNSQRYRKFYKEFIKKSEVEKLEIINFLILSYSENFYLSPYIPEFILNNSNLISATKLSIDLVIESEDIFNVNVLDLIKQQYDFEKAKTIPNILTLDFDKIA